jgi:RNA polymerase sigma-70 factor (ECF subfamily)
MDDKELIQRIAAKDHSAFKGLVERYQALVLNTCLNLLGNLESAEDVAQDVFLEVYRSAKKFRHKSKLSTWIYRIAVNRTLNFIRDNRKFQRLKDIDPLAGDVPTAAEFFYRSNSASPEALLEEKERRKIIQKALDSLPETQKVAFVLHRLGGLSSQEIAEILQVSLSSVEARIHRAKISLQKKLIPLLKKK